MGDDLFKSRSPVVVLKDKARHSERRDFYCQCFLAVMLSDPQALNVVFEGGRGRENAKLNGTHKNSFGGNPRPFMAEEEIKAAAQHIPCGRAFLTGTPKPSR